MAHETADLQPCGLGGRLGSSTRREFHETPPPDGWPTTASPTRHLPSLPTAAASLPAAYPETAAALGQLLPASLAAAQPRLPQPRNAPPPAIPPTPSSMAGRHYSHDA